MIFIKAIFLFVLGSALGSFTNVLVDRGQKGKSLMGRSKCDFCSQELSWSENIPILGFFLVKGKCRTCGKKLSWQYPVVEGLVGLLFFVVGLWNGFVFEVANIAMVIETSFLLFMSFIFVAIVVWDLKYMIIPNFLVASGLIVGFLYEFLNYLQSSCSFFDVSCGISEKILGGIIVGGFFYLLYTFSKGRYIGGGDVKLGFFLGFLVGWKMAYFFLLIAYVLGAIVSIYLLVAKKRQMKSQIPFGPFLIASGFIILFFGEKLVYLYKLLL